MASRSSVKGNSVMKDLESFKILDRFPCQVVILKDFEVIYVNKGFKELIKSDITVPSPFTELQRHFSSEYFDLLSEKIKELNPEKDVDSFDAKIKTGDGEEIDIEVSISTIPLNDKKGVQLIIRDIRRRKYLEELLFQIRQDWEETFHAITDMITIHDKDFNIIYANKTAKEILKLPEFSFNSGLKCFRFYHGTEGPPEGCPSCKCLKTGKPANFELFEPHLNMYIEIRSMPRFDRSGRLIGLIHIARDITERKRIENEIKRAKEDLEIRVEERTRELRKTVEALRESETRYKSLSTQFNTLLDGIPDDLLLISPEMKILWANRAAVERFGKDSIVIEGQYCYGVRCKICSPCKNCPVKKSFESGKEESAEITTNDHIIWDIRAFPILDDSGRVKNVIELARDITENVALQADINKTKHLASIGELAAGVAHEINNPINNIINYAQILIDEFTQESRDTEIPSRIMKDGDRIATIVRSLLSFARIRKEEKSIVNLQDIFSDTLALTSAQLKKEGIHLKLITPPDIIKLYVHPQQLQQVFLNIISNSRYALNQKYLDHNGNKKIEITCEEINLKEKPFIRITFFDNGIGIPSDLIDRVLDPFFSTKPNRMGTGLGLSISHGIIHEHGGKLMIKSKEGEYTKVIIDLPIVEDEIWPES